MAGARDRVDQGPNAHLIGVPGSRGRLDTPALLLDLDALERNIARMAAHCNAAGIALRPHAKTHKSLAIARMQIEAGALGICCATVGEAEIIAGGGIAGVHITSPLTTAAKIERLVALGARAQGLMVAVDHPENVGALDEALGEEGQSLALLVDVDLGQGRTGVASDDDAVALAEAIDAAPALTFAGLQAYAGHLQHLVDLEERRAQTGAIAERLRALAARLAGGGLSPGIVSGGGTGTFALDAAAGAFTELQAGSYTVMDVDYNRVPLGAASAAPFETALFVQGSVVSANHAGFVTTDAGLKRFATDGPVPVLAAGAPPGATYGFKGDEHGRVTFAEAGQSLAIGARIECVTPHCDPTVNLHDRYHCVRGDTLVDIWPVDARGA